MAVLWGWAFGMSVQRSSTARPCSISEVMLDAVLSNVYPHMTICLLVTWLTRHEARYPQAHDSRSAPPVHVAADRLQTLSAVKKSSNFFRAGFSLDISDFRLPNTILEAADMLGTLRRRLATPAATSSAVTSTVSASAPSTSPSSTSAPPTMHSTPPPFFRLPRELRDEIYRLAYVPDNGVAWWARAPKITQGAALLLGEIPPTGPTAPASISLCNQFLDEAAEAWFEGSTIEVVFGHFRAVATAYGSDACRVRKIRVVTCEPRDRLEGFRELHRFPGLEVLELSGFAVFHLMWVGKSRHEGVKPYDDTDFARVTGIRYLLEHPSLQDVSMSLECPEWFESTVEVLGPDAAAFCAYVKRQRQVKLGVVAKARIWFRRHVLWWTCELGGIHPGDVTTLKWCGLVALFLVAFAMGLFVAHFMALCLRRREEV